jgi:predicted RNase H-like HicB family nuclease
MPEAGTDSISKAGNGPVWMCVVAALALGAGRGGDDGAFIAEVPELAGCVADGGTRQDALANVEAVIAEWLDTARELGRPIPEPKGRLLST